MNKIVYPYKVSYKYRKHGDIVPYVYIDPKLELPNNMLLIKLPVPKKHITTIRKYQPINVKYEDDQLKIDIQDMDIYSEHNTPLIDNMETCPVCKSPLFSSDVGIGKCLSLNCPVQIGWRAAHFLYNIGVALDFPGSQILELLLLRGAVPSLNSLFYLPMCDTQIPNAKVFMERIHSVRGKVRVWQFLDALSIPKWHTLYSLEIDKYFTENNLTLKDIAILFTPDFQVYKKDIMWSSWNEVVSLPHNRDVIFSLGTYLYQ